MGNIEMNPRFVSSREKSLNYMEVTAEEAAELEDVRTSGDTAIYSAARELKMLSAYVRFHKDKTPPAPRGRAYYVSKELSYNAQNDVKAYLEQVKRNKANTVAKKPPVEKEKRKDIAQTPEEIRAKLAARGNSVSAGPSLFEARDIYSEAEEFSDLSHFKERKQKAEKPPVAPPLPKRNPNEPIAQTPEEIRKKLEERKLDSANKGKAVFESRDLTKRP